MALALELFPSHNSAPFNGLIARAVDAWGVQHLEVTVLDPVSPTRDASYSFPHTSFAAPSEPRPCCGLKTLKLRNCAPLAAGTGPPQPRAFSSLTTLVLHAMPPNRARLYQRVVRACPALEALRLESCGLCDGSVSIDAPDSPVAELVVESCAAAAREARVGGPFRGVEHLRLRAAPRRVLRPAVLDTFPRSGSRRRTRWSSPGSACSRPTCGGCSSQTCRAGGTCRGPRASSRRAPSLETLHVHVADRDPEGTVVVPGLTVPVPEPSRFEHRALREVAVAGFTVTETHVRFVKFLGVACTALGSISLLKHGRALGLGAGVVAGRRGVPVE